MPRYALIVGIAQYEKFRNLPKAITDAGAIATLLRNYGDYIIHPLPGQLNKEENRWELTLDKSLSAKNLGETLQEFLLEQAKDSDALIYFAGHGFEATGTTGQPEGFLAASDARSNGQNAIRFDDLNKLISRSSLKSLVVMLDCCHAGSFLERGLIESSLSAFNTRQNYYLMTACRGFERAREGEEHGVFTAAVLAGLQADQVDQSGQISCDRLFDFVANRLRQSGQEPIRTGTGGRITLVQHQSINQTVEAIVDDEGNLVCPYQGLEAFTAAQKEFFFGRQKVVEDIRQRLNQSGFVPVIGASGSGKSSVVRAGLIPWLQEEKQDGDAKSWQIFTIKPGVNPLSKLIGVFEPFLSGKNQRKLEAWIEDGDTYPDGLIQLVERLSGEQRFLLVIDQFEEVFTVCANESRRQRFIDLITQNTDPKSRLAVVTTMRADFLESCLRYPTLHHLIQTQAIFMPPLAGVDLKAVIVEPAQRQGFQLEEALLLKILADVGKEPGFLPLLEFALTKLWEKRDSDRLLLTLDQYEALGGLTGALNLYGDRVYQYQDYAQEFPCEERTDQEKEWIKRIFLRLVRTGEGEKDTRQRQPKEKLMAIADSSESQDEIGELLEELVQGRLLVVGSDSEEGSWIDLAHEALIGEWKRFEEWRSQDRELRRLRDRMEDAFHEWQRNPINENLMMGGLLGLTREHWENIRLEVSDSAKQFYFKSLTFEVNRVTQLESALSKAKTYQIEVEKTEVKALGKESESLLALNEEFQGLLVALKAALKLQKSSWKDTELNLQEFIKTTLQKALCWVRERNRLEGHTDYISHVTYSPNGSLIASSSLDGTIRIWDEHGLLLKKIIGNSGIISEVSFHPNSRFIASANNDSSIKIWTLAGTLNRTLERHNKAVKSIDFSPNGKYIISGSKDEKIILWKADGTFVNEFEAHANVVSTVRFSQDGEMIVSGGFDRKVKLWSINGNLIKSFDGCKFRNVNRACLIQDKSSIISASDDDLLKVFELEDDSRKDFSLHSAYVTDFSLSSDEKMMVSSSWDGTVKVSNLDGLHLKTFQGHQGKVFSVNFNSNDRQIISGGSDGIIRIWEISGKVLDHPREVCGISFSNDSKKILSSDENGFVRVWDVTSGELLKVFRTDDDMVWDVKFVPNSNILATSSSDGNIRFWDLDGNLVKIFDVPVRDPGKFKFERVYGFGLSPCANLLVSTYGSSIHIWKTTGELIHTIDVHDSQVTSVCFDQSGRRIASASKDGSVKLWDIKGKLLHSIEERGWFWDISFSPTDNNILIFSGSNQLVKIWNLERNISCVCERSHSAVQSVCFSPDGHLFASASGDKTVKVWSSNGSLVKVLKYHSEWVRKVIFSPDGRFLASAGRDGKVVLWELNLSLPELIKRGCSWMKDYCSTNPEIQKEEPDLCYEILNYGEAGST